MVRVTRGMLVVALLLFVNIQLFILVIRSGDLAASEHQASQFTIAAVTRDSNNPSLRGEGGSESIDNSFSFLKSSEEYVENSMSELLRGKWISPSSSTTDESISGFGVVDQLFSTATSSISSRRSHVDMFKLPEIIRPIRPKGKWLRQVVGTGNTFEILPTEQELLAYAFGENGANGTQQISSRFIRVPVWLNEKKIAKLKSLKSKGRKKKDELRPTSETSILSSITSQENLSQESPEDASIYRNIPCLYSETTGKNVFLVAANSEEWQQLQSGASTGPKLVDLLNGKTKCPLPLAGQKGMSSATSLSASALIGGGGTIPEVSFIIPMHDHVDLTLRCLLNILRFADEVPSAEYVLVDDGSLEDVEEIRVFLKHMKTAFGIRVKFHRQHLGVGYASIMTQASRLAEGKYLMLLNNDVMMTRGAIRALYEIFHDHSDIGVAVPLFVQPNGQILDAGGIIFTDASAWQYGRGVPLNSETSHPYEYIRDVDYGTAACLLIPRQLFLDLGMYDPKYAVNKGAYYEDTDMSFHVRHAGYRVVYTPFSSVLHYESMSYGNKPDSATSSMASSSGGESSSSGTGGGGGSAKKDLMLRGKSTFSNEWGSSLTCTYAHKSVSTQKDAFLPATRFYVLKLLVSIHVDAVNELLCGILARRSQRYSGAFKDGDEDYSNGEFGFVRLRSFLEVLIASKVHITVVVTGTTQSNSNAKCACSAELQYLGIHLVPSYQQLMWPRKPTKQECRYDAILVTGVSTYKHILLDMRDKCAKAPVIFDTSDLSFLRQVKQFHLFDLSESVKEPGMSEESIEDSKSIKNLEGSKQASSFSSMNTKNKNSRVLLSRVPEVGAVAGEVQFMLNSAITLVKTQLEKNAINDQVEKAATMVLPQPVALRPTLAGFASRSGIVYAADLYNTDDVQSLLWFLDEVLPLVKLNIREKYAALRLEIERMDEDDDAADFDDLLHCALLAAAYDVVVHVVQLDGRPLPPAHMLPPKLILLNKTLVVVDDTFKKTSSVVSNHNQSSSIGKESFIQDDIKKNKSNMEGGQSLEDELRQPEHRVLILHDLWPPKKTATSNGPFEDVSSSQLSEEDAFLTPQLQRTPHHKLVRKFHFKAVSRSLLEMEEVDKEEGSASPQTGTRLLSKLNSQKEATIDVIIGRAALSLIKFVISLSWMFVKTCFRLIYGGCSSFIQGEAMDWPWISHDAHLWGRQRARSLRAWWRHGSALTFSSSSLLEKGTRHVNGVMQGVIDDDLNDMFGYGDGSMNNDNDDDLFQEEQNSMQSLYKEQGKIGIFRTKHRQNSDGTSNEERPFQGFGSGNEANDDPFHILDKLYQSARVAVLPLKKSNGAFSQVAAAMSRGIPLVATSAAVSGSPAGFALDGAAPPGDEEEMKLHFKSLIKKQTQYLDSLHHTTTTSNHDSFPDATDKQKGSKMVAPPVMISNDARSFAKLVAHVYTDHVVWRGVTDSAFHALREYSSMPSMIKQTAVLIDLLSSRVPTTMAAAAAASGMGAATASSERQEKSWDNGNLRSKLKGGYGSFTNQVNLARNSMAMKPCSSDHINDLLTFTSK